MFARHHNETPRLDGLIEPPHRRGGFAAPIVVSIAVLIAVVTLGTNTKFIAPPLLALLFTAAVAAVLVSLRRSTGEAAARDSARTSHAEELDSVDTGEPGEILFAASPIPTLLLDGEFHEIIAANAAAGSLYGYALSELRGQRLSKLGYATPTDSEAGDSHPVSGVARHRRKDGSGLWVELSLRQIRHRGRDACLIGIVDVTARMQLLRELEDSERHSRELVDLSLGIVFTHDLDGRLRTVNPAFARALGHSVEDLLGENLSRFVVPRQHDAFNEYLLTIGRDGSHSGAVRMLKQDGGELVWEFRNQVRTLGDGNREVLCCAIDISERSRNERRSLEKSRKDPLTGCYNRRHLDVFQAEAEPGAQWACVVVDIDHLKRYNDAHGHRAGDQALVRLAHFLDRIVRKDDSLVRLGGDEFLILLRHCDQATLESFATRLQAALATHETIPFSFGLAIRKKSEDLEQTIHRADRQMIERRLIERSSIRLDVPREARRQEFRRPVIRIHPERDGSAVMSAPFAAIESER